MKTSAIWLSQILLVLVVGCGMVSACAAPSEPGAPAAKTPALAPTGPAVTAPGMPSDTAIPGATPASVRPATATIPGTIAIAAAAAPTGVAEAALAAETVPFEVLAQGEPLVGQGRQPITLALRGDDPDRVVPDDLPDEAKEALQRALARPDSALYLVVYAGVQPSSGYRVHIDSITTRVEAGREELVVTYSLEEPGPDQGAATVLTYPFIIARVRGSDVGAEDVLFEGP
jgi:hypothetical protein